MNNDTMVDDLADRLPEYPGKEHRTRCFAHVVNLVEKSLLNQFEPPKKSKDDAVDATERDLLVLAEGLEHEDIDTRLTEAEGGGGIERDDVEGLVDEVGLLNIADRAQWETETRPVKMALVKVNKNV